MNWQHDPILEGEHLYACDRNTDLNCRPLRDAEIIGAACANSGGSTMLEIGTSKGQTTALMAQNAPQATIHTVNIPPDEIAAGGVRVTYAPTLEQIGIYYRELGLKNIEQILANTAHWEPNIGPIDLAFIDGCHDARFVYNDTRKILQHCHEGSLILWHDFSLTVQWNNAWHRQILTGVEELFRKRYLRGPIYHLADSWVGLYQVGPRDRFGSKMS